MLKSSPSTHDFHMPGPPWVAKLFQPIHWLFIRCFFQLSVKGVENIPRTGPVLLVPTHRSRWDPILLPALTNRMMRFMASHDEFVGSQGFFMKLFGAFPVNTYRPSPSTLKACVSLLKSGQILVIFPEVTIFYYPPDQVHLLRSGVAWLALKVQKDLPPETPLTIVPVRIRYSVIRPKFQDHAELEAYPAIDISPYLDRPDKQAIADLTNAIQSAMGTVNTSTEEMLKPFAELGPGVQKRSYGRVG